MVLLFKSTTFERCVQMLNAPLSINGLIETTTRRSLQIMFLHQIISSQVTLFLLFYDLTKTKRCTIHPSVILTKPKPCTTHPSAILTKTKRCTTHLSAILTKPPKPCTTHPSAISTKPKPCTTHPSAILTKPKPCKTHPSAILTKPNETLHNSSCSYTNC